MSNMDGNCFVSQMFKKVTLFPNVIHKKDFYRIPSVGVPYLEYGMRKLYDV